MRSKLGLFSDPIACRMRGSSVSPQTGILLCILLMLLSCTQTEREQQFVAAQKKIWEEKITQEDFPTDSIRILLQQSVVSKDEIAVSVLCKELGERMRESSDFSRAIAYHQQGLIAAYKINDTIGITQALNNIGTDFRRIGALPEASDYHYQALQIAEAYSGKKEYTGRKNRIMAINGIGNVHLSFGSWDEAERSFREALAEERALNSHLGQAMNWANIGAIFEEKQMYDSAFLYYQRSMEQNILAGSQLGIGLCYIHFGHIYELQKEYDKAELEYQLAFEVMRDISDTWHWLEATLAIARIRLQKNDFVESKKQIELAKHAATEIQSPEHLSEIHALLHEYNLKQGNYADALNHFKISRAFQDSIQNMQKLNKVIDMRVNYERDKNRQYIAQLNIRNEMEARQKRIILYASIIFVVLLFFLSAALFYAYIQRTKSNKILRNLNRIRINFFTNITHEFRTPLTVILGLSEHMQTERTLPRAETNSYLKAIDRQGKHLLALVNRLLNMSKINTGVDNPDWQKGNIVVYTQMVVDSFRLYAKNKNIILFYKSSEPMIEMDFVPQYIDDIMQNLLSNAIKFSQPGNKVTVTISKHKNKEAVLSVADNGKGIPKEELERIFDLFYQGVYSDKKEGSGIGLNYTRQLVEMMHGRIEVESEENKGSLFTVTLPLQQSVEWGFPLWSHREAGKSFSEETVPKPAKWIHKSDNPALPVKSDKGDAQSIPLRRDHDRVPPVKSDKEDVRSSILLVEDNEDVVLYLKAMLPAVYNTVTAGDGVEGLRLANELVPDIIISDIMMPKKDGLELCRDIRSSELLNHIPIILLTAKSTLDDRLKGLKYGADAYIQKPFHLDELLVRIETLLENRRMLKEKYMRSILKGDAFLDKDLNTDFLQKVTDIIYKEMRNPHFSAVHLAEKLSISSSQLNRKLSAVSGYTPSLYIMRLRIDRAKKKLAFENKPIGQIAEECGFYDMAYFSRTFKKYTDVSPSQYRRLPQ